MQDDSSNTDFIHRDGEPVVKQIRRDLRGTCVARVALQKPFVQQILEPDAMGLVDAV